MALPRLSNATLAGLPPAVIRPAYDRAAVSSGIVHLGIGAFHRAHQAVYVEDCIAAGETDWGIVGASLRSPETRDALAPQDDLYALSIRETDHETLRVVGSVIETLVAPESPAALLDRLVDPRIRIISLTITEKGYCADLVARTLKEDHPDIRHDLENTASPRSALGYLAEALDRRRRAGAPPVTLLSCDNLPSNGATLGRILGQFATMRGGDLARYIEAEIPSPSAMVDRIVPVTTDADRAQVSHALGAEDRWPVMTEPFVQWVIEDRFASGRPALERHGVQFVTDVEPFERMKLRLLNASHSALAAIGRLAGLETIADLIEHPLLARYIDAYWDAVIPAVPVPEAEARAYTRKLVARYANRGVRHRTEQIASDASQKLPQRIVAPLAELTQRGAPTGPLVFAVAAWIRSCGMDDRGTPLVLKDPTFEAWPARPDQASLSTDGVVEAFLGLSTMFGDSLPRNAAFVAALKRDVAAIAAKGALVALEERMAASWA